MTVYILPIQPLEERYTEQWYRWFPEEFVRQGVDPVIIDGQALTQGIEVGTFLDINSTLFYQASQLQAIAALFHSKVIEDGDVFFVADIEFWGIDSIRYLATLNKIDIKMYVFAHAGSYTKEDFFSPCASFARHYEEAWGKIFDKIFVGSLYHKEQLVKLRDISPEKIIVTGNPYDFNDNVLPKSYDCVKEDIVVHTNRPDPEKRPDHTLSLFQYLRKHHPSWRFQLLTGRQQWGTGNTRDRALAMQKEGILEIYEGLEKEEYIDLLSTAQVMTGNSIEENFGYCILEACLVNTIPILPNHCSHPELVGGDTGCLFDQDYAIPETFPSFNYDQAFLIEQAMETPFDVVGYASLYCDSLLTIVEECLRDYDHSQDGI